jgi:hypothetical protein
VYPATLLADDAPIILPNIFLCHAHACLRLSQRFHALSHSLLD